MSQFHQNLVLSVDVVLLALIDDKLHFALVQRTSAPYGGRWTLPGGTVDPEHDETAEHSAHRILLDRACLVAPYIEQLATFTGSKRDPRGWSASIAHIGLVPTSQAVPSKALQWREIDKPGHLPFDHNKMLDAALERLRSKAVYSSLPVHLMPKNFTLAELHAVYEKVMGSPTEITRFRRIMLASEFLEPVRGELRGGYRPAQVYRPRKKTGIDMLIKPLD